MNRYFVIFFLWILSLQYFMAQENDIKHIIREIQYKYAPDIRVEVFQIDTHQKGDMSIIKGVTTSKDAYDELIRILKEKHPDIVDSVQLLPDAQLGDKTEGLVYNSVGTIRHSPRYNSEMITQTLLGMKVKILEENNGWRRIQTPDKYIGWINGSVKPLSKAEFLRYNEQRKVIVTSVYATSYEVPNKSSNPVSDLVIGNILALKSENERFYEVEYPDGRIAFIIKSDALTYEDWFKSIDLLGESITKSALQFKGIPYLWGGTSSKGLDCSGFTKIVYFMHGINLPRDASQQVNKGSLVDSTGEFGNLKPGDLMFFGTKRQKGTNEKGNAVSNEYYDERVVHVGIYLGNNHFIHASDYVRINSLNPSDVLYDKFNADRYLRSKRYIEKGKPVNVDAI
ncbi:MAG: C40 family peptidase [Fermentimonas sp.]|nr:C40 family peptidase [Fermentimonas sp.]